MHGAYCVVDWTERWAVRMQLHFIWQHKTHVRTVDDDNNRDLYFVQIIPAWKCKSTIKCST